MKKAGWVIGMVLCLALLSVVAVRDTQADAVPVKSYVVSQLVVEINRIVTILNTVLDSSNNLEGSKLAADSVGSAAIGTIAQSDTNATTTAASYTPAFVGQVLVGSQGSGTNAVWISKGTTTNDWVIVEP